MHPQVPPCPWSWPGSMKSRMPWTSVSGCWRGPASLWKSEENFRWRGLFVLSGCFRGRACFLISFLIPFRREEPRRSQVRTWDNLRKNICRIHGVFKHCMFAANLLLDQPFPELPRKLQHTACGKTSGNNRPDISLAAGTQNRVTMGAWKAVQEAVETPNLRQNASANWSKWISLLRISGMSAMDSSPIGKQGGTCKRMITNKRGMSGPLPQHLQCRQSSQPLKFLFCQILCCCQSKWPNNQLESLICFWVVVFLLWICKLKIAASLSACWCLCAGGLRA